MRSGNTPSDPADLVSLTGDGGEERSAYSSDKVVKFGVRGVSHGFICRLKALQAACLEFNVCQIMEFVEQATVLGALIPRCCRNFRSSPLLRVSRTFSVIYIVP